MVVIGTFRDKPELRKSKRQHCRYPAAILTGKKNDAVVRCNIYDISESGARLLMEVDRDLPSNFMLLLTRDGRARRYCRLIWKEHLNVGVEFQSGHAAE